MGKKKRIGFCKLCELEKPLIKGHIIPKWAGLLAPDQKMLALVTIEPDEIKSLTGDEEGQGMVAEYLFCGKCDETLGKGEAHIRQIVHPTTKKPGSIHFIKRKGASTRGAISDPMVRNELLAALGGILYKAHLTNESMYKNFVLPSYKAKALKRSILNNSFYNNLSFTIFKLYNIPKYKVEGLEEYFENDDAPFQIQAVAMSHNPDIYAIIMGGCLIVIHFAKGKGGRMKTARGNWGFRIAPLDMRYILHGEKVIDTVALNKLTHRKEVTRMIQALAETGGSPCPCQVGYRVGSEDEEKREIRLFENCCKDRWFLS